MGILWLAQQSCGQGKPRPYGVGLGGGRAEDGAKLAGGEGFEGAEAGFEFDGGYAALA